MKARRGINGREETESRKQASKGEIATLRKRLQKSRQVEFIRVLSRPPEEVELQKDRFASQFQEIENSGIEINPENETQREEDLVSEMRADSPLGRETVQNEGIWPGRSKLYDQRGAPEQVLRREK